MPTFTKISPYRKKRGFTLIEIMIVVAIIVILAILAMFMLTNNLAKSRDGKRKADLDRLKIAFEEYYGDQNSYPDESMLTNCGGEELKPYLSSIPCDPKTKKPYCYIYDADYGGQNYRLLSSLETSSDPIISKLGCADPDEYCGYESECVTYGRRFNYGVSSSNVVVASENIGSGSVVQSPSPSPTTAPLPSTIPGSFACTRFRVCDNYGTHQNAINSGCGITWNQAGCGGMCGSIPASALCN